MGRKKHIVLSVTNDLESDQRLHKVCSTLIDSNYSVLLIGRKLSQSKNIQRNYPTKRFKLWFSKGPLFYLNYNCRLFIFLLFHKYDLAVANDLDTLSANYLAAKLKGKPLLYDSHELFTEVPELLHRPFVKKIWEKLEVLMLPKIQFSYTVSSKVADFYERKYGIKMRLVRNFPILKTEPLVSEKQDAIIYQGALNVDRGLEELIESMVELPELELWIAGSGDVEDELKNKVKQLKLEEQIKFLGRLSFEELAKTTSKAKIGVSLEKKEALNYQYALPNKVFDYIHAGIPVLFSDLEEVKQVVERYEIGEVLISHDPKEIALQLKKMILSEKYATWVKNCRIAALELNWQNEKENLMLLVKTALKEEKQ